MVVEERRVARRPRGGREARRGSRRRRRSWPAARPRSSTRPRRRTCRSSPSPRAPGGPPPGAPRPLPVSGCTPPFASVAPTSARSRQSTRTAHCRKYRSSATSGSPITPKVRSRCAIARLRCPVTRSDSNTASSTSRARPAKPPYASSTAANDAPSATREEAVIAPAFTIAFDGTPRLGRERDRVERVAARLDPDARADGLRAVQVEREGVGQRLRDRLEREADPRVARLVDGAVDRRDRDPEERRIDVGELRDVRRERAAASLPSRSWRSSRRCSIGQRNGSAAWFRGVFSIRSIRLSTCIAAPTSLQRKEAPERTSAPRPRCRERRRRRQRSPTTLDRRSGERECELRRAPTRASPG